LRSGEFFQNYFLDQPDVSISLISPDEKCSDLSTQLVSDPSRARIVLYGKDTWGDTLSSSLRDISTLSYSLSLSPPIIREQSGRLVSV